ncbi:uncharacterized protein CLUP02_11528 [Colletotrichum lupini]|uniref:Secreted protein n=1 Tax=Colletotrichum lupini TaxID=145971 RepID=A0A9Q8SYS1_9PEZI|nr:uncharacterized protein CLUP02_11528 [Colletotrichum lupini]KAK1707409.1 hypothetical protein BDP67DRAFT_156526 [Colletotrichum lupini]UQC86029.1 hypothetical protein CLUP02_11528 [Colletotrichum lupini]
MSRWQISVYVLTLPLACDFQAFNVHLPQSDACRICTSVIQRKAKTREIQNGRSRYTQIWSLTGDRPRRVSNQYKSPPRPTPSCVCASSECRL